MTRIRPDVIKLKSAFAQRTIFNFQAILEPFRAILAEGFPEDAILMHQALSSHSEMSRSCLGQSPAGLHLEDNCSSQKSGGAHVYV